MFDGDQSALRDFWRQVASEGTPLRQPSGRPGHSLVTFVVRDSTPDVKYALESNITVVLSRNVSGNVDPMTQLQRLDGTDVHYLELELADELRSPYAFRRSEGQGSAERVLDPNARETFAPDSRWARSVVSLPEAPSRPWRSQPTPGEWRAVAFESDALGGERQIEIYLPAGYDAQRARPYPAIVAMDGFGYKEPLLPAARILEHLIGRGEIQPAVLVLTEDLGPIGDAGSYDPAVRFIADEVLPLVTRRFNVSDAAADRTLVGASRRGMLASLIAFERPSQVGQVLSLSGSYYWTPANDSEPEWLPRRYADAPLRPIRLYLAAGTLETFITDRNGGHYLLATNRHMRNVLSARGYDFGYREFVGVHSEVNWEVELAAGLRWLSGQSG